MPVRPIAIASALALALCVFAQPVLAAHHEPVLFVVTVDVKPGQFENYRKQVQKLTGMQKRLGSRGQVRMWRATLAGPDTGEVIVAIEYPNVDAWAADSQKLQADAEYQRTIAGLDSLRSIESSSLWRDITPIPLTGKNASLLVLTALDVKPGKLAAYRERVKGASKIIDRVGTSGRGRLWQAEIAGPNTGSVVFGVEYADLSTYLSDQNKLMGDAEYRSFAQGLSDVRSYAGRSIYQEVSL